MQIKLFLKTIGWLHQKNEKNPEAPMPFQIGQTKE
jgi:hypothetical protein